MRPNNFQPLLLKLLKYCFVVDEFNRCYFTNVMSVMIFMGIIKHKNAPIITLVNCIG